MNDLSVRTDSEGNAVVLFIGRRDPNGDVRGERYARTLKRDKNGQTIKDHWDLKGRS